MVSRYCVFLLPLHKLDEYENRNNLGGKNK